MMARKIGSVDYTPFILLGALGIGAYFLYSKLAGGSAASASNNAAIDQSTSSAVASDLATQQAAGTKQTLGNAQLSGMASEIYSLGTSSTTLSSTDQDRVVQIMSEVKTSVDLLVLQNYFGTKQASTFFSSCNLMGIDCTSYDLSAWLNAILDAQHLAEVNQYLAMQGIVFSF
jgi:hypothetical protein